MKITQEDFAVILDTVRNSCRVNSSQEYLFGYTNATRRTVSNKLSDQLAKHAVEIKFEDNDD